MRNPFWVVMSMYLRWWETEQLMICCPLVDSTVSMNSSVVDSELWLVNTAVLSLSFCMQQV